VFKQLKNILANKPVLQLYRIGSYTELWMRQSIDMELFYCRAIVKIMHCNSVYYSSGRTIAAKENYISYELEVFAIVKALKKFCVYLIGLPFTG